MEEFAPVAITRLGLPKLQGQAFIVGQPADEVGFGAHLHRLQFFIADVLGLEAFNFGMNGFFQLFGGMSFRGSGEEIKQVWIFSTGKAAAFSLNSNLFVAHQRAVEA